MVFKTKREGYTMRTYRVEGTVNVRTANREEIAVRPVHYGEFATHHEAIADFRREHGDARNITWSVV
jgi:hypothetical protein